MKPAAKVVLYIVLIALAAVCFGRFRSEYSATSGRGLGAGRGVDAAMAADDVALEPEGGPGGAVAATNGMAAVVVGPVPGTTNVASGMIGTNGTALVGAGKATNPVVGIGASGAGVVKGRGKAQAFYLAGFVLGMLGLAGMVAWDLSQFVARKTAHGLGVDLSPIEGDPEYDAAEEAWASGDYLGAITLLRDFLKRHPNQQHAALRIAEIYEKDLGNHLAAALELEDVLQKRLPREKWGWTAVHLANLYSGRLNQPDKALEVLHRIVDGYPETAAARKARHRLGLPEPEALGSTAGSLESGESGASSAEAPAGDDPMPRGFKVKRK